MNKTDPMFVRHKKSQVQMFETIAAMIIFFFLIAFGMGFYFYVSKVQFLRDLERQEQLKSLEVGIKATRLQELDCVKVDIQQLRCFDKFKMDAFACLTGGKKNCGVDQNFFSYYFDIFADANITVRELYPTYDKEGVTLYFNVMSEYIGFMKKEHQESGDLIVTGKYQKFMTDFKRLNKRSVAIPVIIKDPTHNKESGGLNKFGILEITIFTKPVS